MPAFACASAHTAAADTLAWLMAGAIWLGVWPQGPVQPAVQNHLYDSLRPGQLRSLF